MQLRIDPQNAKAIKSIADEYKRKIGRRKSNAAIANELIRRAVSDKQRNGEND